MKVSRMRCLRHVGESLLKGAGLEETSLLWKGCQVFWRLPKKSFSFESVPRHGDPREK